MRRKPYRYLAMGGSFDRLHDGHKHFIDFAAALADKIHIGITTQKLTLKKDYADIIESFKTRKKAVTNYCRTKNITCSTSELNDIYGPTVLEDEIDALCVTEETLWGANKINQARVAMSKKDLPVHVCPWLKDETGEILSSTRIRNGKINRRGQVYEQILKQDLVLNRKQREFFTQKQGGLAEDRQIQKLIKNSDKLYIVGDTSLDKFLNNDWQYQFAVYDKKSQRKDHISAQIDRINYDLDCENPAGRISLQLSKALQECLKNNFKHLFVAGEEDTATLALVLLLPLGTHIFYGQPSEGIVDILVTESVKEKFYKTLQ